MRSHAIANGLFVAAVNRTGVEGQLEFWGASFVADPNGNVLARASHDREETAAGRVRPGADRFRPHPLAFPPRPPHRRLRRLAEAIPGVAALSQPINGNRPTPAALGYHMPAEWEPHRATWLSWPRRRQTWPGKFEPIPQVWATLAKTLARFETVRDPGRR